MICFENIQLSFSNMGLFNTKEPWIHPKRKIDSYEIIYVLNGEFKMLEEEKVYQLKKNDILILHPNVIHAGIEKTDGEVKFYWLHFYCENFEAFRLKKHYTNETNNNHYIFRELMNLQETVANPILTDLKLAELLFKLQSDANDSQTKLTSEIKEYIRINSNKKLTVQGVCAVFGYNADYLSKSFSKHVGISLKEYIVQERIKHIKTYLLSTNFSVKEIADLCDFEDDNTFVKFFKYNTKTTPTKYRNKHNNLHMNKE